MFLEFHLNSQSVIPELNKKYPIYLRSGSEKVILHPIEILKGDFRITQVVLKPAVDLREGNTYELVIDSLSKEERIANYYHPSTGKYGPPSFVVSCDADMVAPFFISVPVEKEKWCTEFGCGPAKTIHYKCSTNAQSVSLIRTFVKNLSSGKITVYILSIKDSIINVGNDMCSGPFLFNEKDKYEISFAPVSSSGSTGNKTIAVALDPPLRKAR